MKTNELVVLLKNSASNVLRGASGTILAIVLPPFLTRAMSPDAFGAWSLILQVGAYVGFLDFGIQTSVGRYVARATELHDYDQRNRIINSALAILTISGIVAILALMVAAALVPQLFQRMPVDLCGEVRIGVLLVGGSLAVGLPASVINGVYVGLQRNEIPAAIIGASRLICAVLLVIAVRHGASLVEMSIILAGTNLASYLLGYHLLRQFVPGVQFARDWITVDALREIMTYSSGLSIWLFGMLMVNGLDLAIVGHFQFGAVAYYAVAASAVAFIAGIQNAIFSAMLPAAAVLHARNSETELGHALLTSTRLSSLLLIATALPLCFAAKPALRLWVGYDYARHGAVLLIVLVLANVIRLVTTPYAVVLMGTGQQRLATFTVLAEGVTNVAASLVLGRAWGAVGVAVGTLIGSVICLLGHIVRNMPRTQGVVFSRSQYIQSSLIRPILCAIPSILTLWAGNTVLKTGQLYLAPVAAVEFLAISVIWGLSSEDRAFVRLAVRQAAPSMAQS